MIDVASRVATGLIADGVENVAADLLPTDTPYPAVLVRCLRWDDVTGAQSHHSATVQVDVIGSARGFADGTTLTGLVLDSLHTLGVRDVSVVQVTDDEYSPARPRWVLTGDLLVRNN